ncbi:MAG: twin-arginine translocase TatA/TatE family subunit [Actinobacteria bacterium]|nr:twin-arginine translocase TatA/TatE family subunit [Actinomycetota bacterium]
MFNLTGSEIAFLVLIGLIVLGPEKLPDAVRRFTKGYNEFKKMAGGFQGEMKQAFEEPMRELRGTADAVRKAAEFDIGLDLKGLDLKPTDVKKPEAVAPSDGGLNFGTANPRRQQRKARDISQQSAADAPADEARGSGE